MEPAPLPERKGEDKMKETMILLAGYPATGKSYLCKQILEKYPQFQVISQDDMKEALWDEYGFDSMEEKTKLEMLSWEKYYKAADEKMQEGRMLISDYPFSEKQKGRLADLAEKNKYQMITIRLTGDIDILYERSRRRDLDPSRHLGHLVSKYHLGDEMEDRSKADCIVTHDIFRERCMTRGYDTFELGILIEIDATDYKKINYSKILEQIGRKIESGGKE